MHSQNTLRSQRLRSTVRAVAAGLFAAALAMPFIAGFATGAA
jgi:hypothetical protein